MTVRLSVGQRPHSSQTIGRSGLVGFGFRTSVLMRNPILVEEFSHFSRHHICIVGHGYQWELFPGFRSV